MNSLKKQLLSSLFLTSLIATAPLCAISANGNEDNVEIQEEIEETAKPWYKQSEAKKTALVCAIGIAWIYAIGYWQKNMNPIEFTRYIKENIRPIAKGMWTTFITGGMGTPTDRFKKATTALDIQAEIQIKSAALVEKFKKDIALTKSFLSNDPNYTLYLTELDKEFLNSMTELYKQYGYKGVVTMFGNQLSDGSTNFYASYR